MIEVEAAQAQIRQIAGDLKGIRFRLLGVLASLPPAWLERDRDSVDIELIEPQEEIIAILQCVIQDNIGPAIQDLDRVASSLSERRYPDE